MKLGDNRTTKERRLEVMIKGILVFGIVCAVLCVALLVLAAVNSSLTEKCVYLLRFPAIGFFGAGAFMIVLPFVVSVEDIAPTAKMETQRIESAFFKELSDNLGSRIAAEGYSDTGEVFRNDEYAFRLYEKAGFNLYRFIAVIMAFQLNDAILESANNCFINQLQNRGLEHDRVSLLVLFVVDKDNALLREAIQSNTEQELNSYKYSASIIRSSKRAIFTNKKDGLAIIQYKNLRKLFLRIISNP